MEVPRWSDNTQCIGGTAPPHRMWCQMSDISFIFLAVLFGASDVDFPLTPFGIEHAAVH